jgi:hypothetical protein
MCLAYHVMLISTVVGIFHQHAGLLVLVFCCLVLVLPVSFSAGVSAGQVTISKVAISSLEQHFAALQCISTADLNR